MSVSELAERIQVVSSGRVDIEPALIWQWLTWEVFPDQSQLRWLAAALSVDAGELYATVRSDWDRAPGGSPSAKEPSSEEDIEYWESFDMITRRGLLKSLGLTAVGAAVSTGTRPGKLALEDLDRQTEELSRNFAKLATKDLEFKLGHYRRLVNYYLTGARIRDLPALHTFSARLKALSGLSKFLHHGEVAGAVESYLEAISLANEVGATEIVAWSIAELASMACYQGNYGVAVDVPELRRIPTVALRANIMSNAVRGFSQLGDAYEGDRAMRLTEQFTLAIRPDEDSTGSGPTWSFSQISGFTRMAEGWLHLKEPRRALASAENAVSLAGGIDRTIYTANAKLLLAAAHVQLGETEEGCRIASSTLALYPKDFYTIRLRGQEILKVLDGQKDRPAVRALREELDYHERGNPCVAAKS